MRGLTLHQPWASFVASGAKRIETRGWSTRYRGGLLIHAAKKWTRLEQAAAARLNGTLYGRAGLTEQMVQLRDRQHRWIIPLGAVVARAQLVDVVEMTEELIFEQTDQELEFGDWQVRRWAWLLDEIVAIEPIAVNGGQRLWIPSASLVGRCGGVQAA